MNRKNNKIILYLLIAVSIGMFGTFAYLFAEKAGIIGADRASINEDVYTPAEETVWEAEYGPNMQEPSPTETPKPSPTETPKPAPTKTPKPSPTKTPKPSPTKTPQPTSAPTQRVTNEPAEDTSLADRGYGSAAVRDSSLHEFRDESKGISCLYPASFVERNGYDDVLYYVQSKDRSAGELIDVEYADGRTPEQACDEFISDIGGTVVLENVTDDSFEVQVYDDGVSYYQYGVFANGNIYWFAFVNQEPDDAYYEQYRDAIKKSLKIL